MKSLLTKVVAPFVVAGSLFFAQPQKVEAENRSNVNFSLGGFLFSDKELSEYYAGLFGGGVGIDVKLNGDYFRWGADISAFSKRVNKDNIESNVNLFQYSSTIQIISKNDMGMIYGEFGPVYVQVHVDATDGKENVDGNVDAAGFIGKVGGEFPWKNSKNATFFELSYCSALNGNLQLGGGTLSLGAKYYLGD